MCQNKKLSLTISQILNSSPLSRRETESLLIYLSAWTREFILTHPETTFNKKLYSRFLLLAKKRQNNWPLAYLTGHQEFFGLDFFVNQRVLIPRPETEWLVEETIKTLPHYPNQLTIIDVGTGSGAIIISLAVQLITSTLTSHQNIEFIATDISRRALQVARHNATKHNLQKIITFKRGDLLQAIQQNLQNCDLIIIANLPYLSPQQINTSPSISHEPRLALDGGVDGLNYYRRLCQQLVKINYRSALLLWEIDPAQKPALEILINTIWPHNNHQFINDLRGQCRFLKLKI